MVGHGDEALIQQVLVLLEHVGHFNHGVDHFLGVGFGIGIDDSGYCVKSLACLVKCVDSGLLVGAAAGGKGEALLFKKGEVVGKIPEDRIIETLMEEIEKMKGTD